MVHVIMIPFNTRYLQAAYARVTSKSLLLAYLREHNVTQLMFHFYNNKWKSKYYDLALGFVSSHTLLIDVDNSCRFGVYYWIMALSGTTNVILYAICWHNAEG